MVHIVKEGKKFAVRHYSKTERLSWRFTSYEEAVQYIADNPHLGPLRKRASRVREDRWLYFRTYKDGRQRWEVRFSKTPKGYYTASFVDKQDAVAFRDQNIERWEKDPSFLKEDLRKNFLSYKYKIPVTKQEEIQSLKMQIETLSEILKELENGN